MKRGDSADYALEPSQVDHLIRSCVTLEELVLIRCQLHLGLRISEVGHMKSIWVTDLGMLRVPSKQPCQCPDCQDSGAWQPKTKAGARTLPIPGSFRPSLVEFLSKQQNGFQQTRQGLYYRTKKVLVRAKIQVKGLAQDTVYPHVLRATCATMLAAGGMDAAGLTYFMGWANIAMGSHYIQIAQAKDLAARQATQIFK